MVQLVNRLLCKIVPSPILTLLATNKLEVGLESWECRGFCSYRVIQNHAE